jgi:hypothetical protein
MVSGRFSLTLSDGRPLVGVVDFHLGRRKSVLDLIVRLQGQERFILQQWLFNFWVFSYRPHSAWEIKQLGTLPTNESWDIIEKIICRE